MKDDTGRSGGGEKGLPSGARVRNRTVVLGTRNVQSLVDPVGSAQMGTPASDAESGYQQVDPLGLGEFEREDASAPVSSEDDFSSLDEIFGVVSQGHNERHAQEQSDPFGLDRPVERDASSTRMNAVEEDPFESVLDVFEPSPGVVPPLSQPRIVGSASDTGESPSQEAHADFFDPFAAMESEESQTPPAFEAQRRHPLHEGDDVVVHPPLSDHMREESSGVSAAPKIVRPGEMGAAHQRIITPSSHQGAPAPTFDEVKSKGNVPPHQPVRTPKVAKEGELMTEARDQIFWKNESPLVGFLVTYDHDTRGAYVELRQGRLMVSNQREESGSCFVVAGESVSPMHAIMRVAADGVVQVLDQLSEAGTRVKHIGQSDEEFLSGEKSTLSHGDIVFFGDRKFHVLLVAAEMDEA